MKTTSEKQFTVEDWVEWINKSPTKCKRSITNARLKRNGGHPLSTSEYNLLDAASMVGV